MGKGILAALVGAGAKQFFLKALAEKNTDIPEKSPSPAFLTQRVQQLITPGLFKLESFVTTVYTRINLEKKTLIFSDCGHTPFLHYSATTNQCRVHKGSNTPLGVQKKEKIQEITIDIQTGDLVLLLSDGIIETNSTENKLFGIDRLCRFVETHHNLSPEQILNLLEKELDRFRGAQELQDDMTSICIRIPNTDFINRKDKK